METQDRQKMPPGPKAYRLLEDANKGLTDSIAAIWEESEANNRMKELSKVEDYRLARHLWSGLTVIRPGAGVAIVGNPQQVVATLQQFIDIGCTDFCLSGYLHDQEATRVGQLVLPHFRDRRAAEF